MGKISRKADTIKIFFASTSLHAFSVCIPINVEYLKFVSEFINK